MILFLVLLPACLAGKQSWEINTVHDGAGTAFGDMLLTPQQLSRYDPSHPPLRGVSVKETAFNRWEDNTLPYALSPQYTEAQKAILRSSLKGLEAVSCFRFKERTSEEDYVYIVPLDGCYSYVGKVGKRQLMSLAVDCLADYIIWHEVMHALGFEHEHQRPDRDSFIRVEYRNVMPGQMVNFEKINAAAVDFPDTYDYESIMHYDGFAFGRFDQKKRRRMATMIPLKNGVVLDDNMAFSATDIAKLNRLGNCDAPKQSRSNNNKKPSATSCTDRSQMCSELRRRGACDEPRYAKIMERECAQTCRMCSFPGKGIAPTEQNEEDCNDTHSSCADLAHLCTSPGMRDFMTLACPKTCNRCPHTLLDVVEMIATEPPSKPCVDVSPNCANYAKNGFCNNAFYKQIREEQCAKTCNAC